MKDVIIRECGTHGKSEFLLRQCCNIQFSIENTKIYFLKVVNRCSDVSGSVDARRRACHDFALFTVITVN